jgi:hypothetical protein
MKRKIVLKYILVLILGSLSYGNNINKENIAQSKYMEAIDKKENINDYKSNVESIFVLITDAYNEIAEIGMSDIDSYGKKIDKIANLYGKLMKLTPPTVLESAHKKLKLGVSASLEILNIKQLLLTISYGEYDKFEEMIIKYNNAYYKQYLRIKIRKLQQTELLINEAMEEILEIGLPDGIYYSDGVQKLDVFFDKEILNIYGNERFYIYALRSVVATNVEKIEKTLVNNPSFYPRRKVVKPERVIVLSTENKDEKILFFERIIEKPYYISFVKIITKINANENREIDIDEEKIKINLYVNDKKEKIRIETYKKEKKNYTLIKRKDFVFIEKINDESMATIHGFQNFKNILDNDQYEYEDLTKLFIMKTPIYEINKKMDKVNNFNTEVENVANFHQLIKSRYK